MLQCWSLSSDLRPSFSNIVAKLEALLQSSQDYLDVSDQSETEFITSSDPFLCNQDSLPSAAFCGSEVVCQDDTQSLEPLAGDKTRQTRGFPNLSYQTVVFTGNEA